MPAEPEITQAVAPQRPGLEQVMATSALLHAVRAATLQVRLEAEVAQRRHRWRMAGPVPAIRLSAARVGHRFRFAVLVARRLRRALAEDGPRGALDRIRRRLAGSASPARPAAGSAVPVPKPVPGVRPAGAFLARRVLIVAELSIPQCAKYRVWQKREAFGALGIDCTVIDWHRHHDARSALQTHALLILYRVPGDAEILALLEEARRLGVPSLWEVDDLIFDVELYAQNANLVGLPARLRRELLDGAARYRIGMCAADATIASTATLAEAMQAATGTPCHVVENALDAQTRAFARRDRAARNARPDAGRATVDIVYGSGTRTHDADFRVATPALIALLERHAEIRLRIVGDLVIDPAFDRFGERIERIERTHFEAYLAELAAGDIAIAPLEDTRFNDAKSNIKLIEASILGLPSVCSPRRTFVEAITHGVDGRLAANDAQWLESLTALVGDRAERERIGAAARARVERSYAPEVIARRDVAPLAALMPVPARARRRILVVNVFFSPRSFGGATVIAEEMSIRLDEAEDTEIVVFTTRADGPAYTIRRERARGLEVFAVATRAASDDILTFDDPEMARCFEDVLDATSPDLVHFHSIQTLGVALLRSCQRRSVPYVVTVHDAWWLCTRQFMVRADNHYCHQRTIDLKVCEACVPTAAHLPARLDLLLQGLDGASLILSPSASHLSLYAANGLDPARLRVNRNGIRPPATARLPRASGPLRFGYVGGNEKLKGVELVRRAFASIARTDWHLVLVDNLLNLGSDRGSYERKAWRLPGRVEIVPAYRQAEIDRFFAGIDVLLFPSQWKESFGLTVREALARDVWVIATDCGGGAEAVVDGVNGDIVPMDNRFEPMRAAIERLLEQPDRVRANENPMKSNIRTLDDQAVELDILLRMVLP